MPRASLTVFVACRIRAAGIALLVLATSAAAHGGDTDVVNERPPVTRRALEEHWGVDCAALRRELLQADAQSLAAAREGAPARRARWRSGLRLCGAIHNAPGDDKGVHCPDYAQAARAMGTAADDASDRDDKRLPGIRDALRCEQ